MIIIIITILRASAKHRRQVVTRVLERGDDRAAAAVLSRLGHPSIGTRRNSLYYIYIYIYIMQIYIIVTIMIMYC